MPSIGEIKIDPKSHQRFMWAACENCKGERWVGLIKGQPRNKLCRYCSPKIHLQGFKTGRRQDKEGYIRIWLPLDDFFYPMAGETHTVLEHRLVMAKHLKRCLLPWETVHHKGTKYPIGSKEDRGDNRIENLELFPARYKHDALTRMSTYIKKLEREVIKLRYELEIR